MCSFWARKIMKDGFGPGTTSGKRRTELIDDTAANDVVQAIRALTRAALKRRSIDGAGTVQKELTFRDRSVLARGEVVKRRLRPRGFIRICRRRKLEHCAASDVFGKPIDTDA